MTTIVQTKQPFTVPEESRNLSVGSSITARIKTETLANDTRVHSYRVSTPEEKIKLFYRYPEKNVKMRFVQDGPTLFIKTNFPSPDEFIYKF